MTNKDILTQRTKLRKYKESDKNTFIQLFTDKEVNHFMGGANCETYEDAIELFEKGFKIYEGFFPDRHFELWAIEYENQMIGHFELKQTSNTSDSELEIVYMLGKEYWGKGLMPEIINEVNKYASGFGKQLIATINPENIKTVKALNKIGIEKEEWTEDEDGEVYKVWLKAPVL